MTRLEKLKRHHLECNVFSVHDYPHLSILELVHLLFKKVNEVIGNIHSIDEVTEYLMGTGLKIEVVNQLTKWLESGELSDIINETAFNDLYTKVVKNNEVNFSVAQPTYMCEVETLPGKVIQGIAYDLDENYIYVTQNFTREGDNIESFYLIRCYPNGMQKDYMTFIEGGHGTTFGFEKENNEVYIYSTWAQGDHVQDGNVLPNTVPHKIGRIKYQPGRTILKDDITIQWFETPFEGYFVPTLSSDQKKIALRYDRDVYIIDLDRYKLNDLTKMCKITVPSEYYYLQGMTLDSKYFYWRSGDGIDLENNHLGAFADTITKYDIETGELVDKIELKYQYVNNSYEPEDICLLEKDGEKCMILGGQVGGRYARKRSAWILGNNALANNILGQSKMTNEKTEIWSSGFGKTKWVDPSITKISDITAPGYYYFDSSAFAKMTDKPIEDSDTSAYFLFVSPRGKTESNIFQELTRCSSTRGGYYRSSRYVDLAKGEVSPWLGNSQEVTLWSGNTSSMDLNTVIKLKDSINNYDFIYLKYTGMAGGNSEDMMLSVNQLSSNKIIKTGMNFADSDTNKFYFYEHELTLSSDRTSITLSGQRRYWINTNTMGGDLDSKEYGLSKIVGIRI